MKLSECVNQVRAAGCRKEKVDLFKKFVETVPNFGEMVSLAMDPSIAFNVGKNSVEVRLSLAEKVSGVLTSKDFETLRLLASRKMNRTKGAEWANKRCSELLFDEAQLLVAILDKDLSWGLGAGTINTAIPGFLFEFSCMLAEPYDSRKIEYPCRIEPKYDGMRVLSVVGTSGVKFYTRSGKPVTSLPESLEKSLQNIASKLCSDEGCDAVVIDGEVMGKSFKETMEKARRKSEVFHDATYHVFDWLPYEAFRKAGKQPWTEKNYAARRQALVTAVNLSALKFNDGPASISFPPSYVASSEEEVTHYYGAFRDKGFEGAIIKAPNSGYVGKRSSAWIKMKAEDSEDLEIIGFEEGEGKFVGTLGALIVDRKGVPVRVGSGISDEDRNLIWRNREVYRHKLAEVQFQEVTEAGSLRHPRFVSLRMDKSEW